MWTSRVEELPKGRGQRFVISFESRPATFAEVLCGWQEDAEFRTLFNSLLAETPYTAFRWETPGVTTETLSQPFEFVVLDSPSLARRPAPTAFAEHFRDANAEVGVFPNRSGDAVMVVPYPIAGIAAYGHLAAFVRLAPESQWHALWRTIGDLMQHRIGTRPVWLSTAGAGVSWLHVRLDDRPKYYGFAPYKS